MLILKLGLIVVILIAPIAGALLLERLGGGRVVAFGAFLAMSGLSLNTCLGLARAVASGSLVAGSTHAQSLPVVRASAVMIEREQLNSLESDLAAERSAHARTRLALEHLREIAAGRPMAQATPVSPLRARVDAGVTVQSYRLLPLAVSELVAGQPGSYYRITCLARNGARIAFDNGRFRLNAASVAALKTCIKNLTEDILSPVAAEAPSRLYAQGFAGGDGYAKPRQLSSSDTALAASRVHARRQGPAQFEAAATATPRTTYDNADLPNLRAAAVAVQLEQTAAAAYAGGVLTGEIRPDADAASKSFDLLLYVRG
jgi:hypothetical protein